MTGMFKGLDRFNLDDYNKVKSRVTSDHLAFFVKQYCENAGLGYRDEGEKRSRSSLQRSSSSWRTIGGSAIHTPSRGAYRLKRWGMRRSTRRSLRRGAPPAPFWRPRVRGDGATRAIPRFLGSRVARYAG